jgi:hypothetical protein
VIVTSLFISSCSSPYAYDFSGERRLQESIERKANNCELLFRLSTFAGFKNIDLDYAPNIESVITTTDLFKKYAFEVLEISKQNNHFNKTEYIKELENAIQEIDKAYLPESMLEYIGERLPESMLESIGERYLPDCEYFLGEEIFNDPPEQEATSETAPLPSTRKQIDIVLEAPSLVFWGIPFQITARSSNGEMDYCIFKFGGSNSMYAETLGKVIATQGIAEITHTLVWNGGLGSTAWSQYWAVCGVDGREIEIDSVDVQGAR